MTMRDFKKDYNALYEKLLQEYPQNKSKIMAEAVGGQFDEMGLRERELLIERGVKPDHYLVDVGCGPGRLAKQLAGYLRGRYLGIDVVEAFVDYARELCGRPEWRFEIASGLTIPESDGEVDIVCFFSVFTHLLHEES